MLLCCVWTHELMFRHKQTLLGLEKDLCWLLLLPVGLQRYTGFEVYHNMKIDSYHTMCICCLRYWIILYYCWKYYQDEYCVPWYCETNVFQHGYCTVKISFHCNTSRHKHGWNSCYDTPSISSTSGYGSQVINIQREHDMTPTVDMVRMTHR